MTTDGPLATRPPTARPRRGPFMPTRRGSQMLGRGRSWCTGSSSSSTTRLKRSLISALQSESFSRGVPEPAPKQRRSPPRATGVTRHLALNEVQPTEPGLASLAIALDSATVACMETQMRVVQVHERRGTQLECRLSPQASEAFGRRPEAGEILGAEREVSEGFGPRAVSCWQIEEPGRFLIEFAPSANGIPAAYRDHFRVCIFGDVDQDRKRNLTAALQQIGLPGLAADADPLQEERLKRMDVLRMVALSACPGMVAPARRPLARRARLGARQRGGQPRTDGPHPRFGGLPRASDRRGPGARRELRQARRAGPVRRGPVGRRCRANPLQRRPDELL